MFYYLQIFNVNQIHKDVYIFKYPIYLYDCYGCNVVQHFLKYFEECRIDNSRVELILGLCNRSILERPKWKIKEYKKKNDFFSYIL